MPIRPENKARYPADWPAISRRVRDEAGNRCKQCGVENGAMIHRGWHGKMPAWRYQSDTVFECSRCAIDGSELHGTTWDDFEVARGTVKVVLTVAHLGRPSQIPFLFHMAGNAKTNEVFNAVGLFMPLNAKDFEWRHMMHHRTLSEMMRVSTTNRARFIVAFPGLTPSAPPRWAVVSGASSVPVGVGLTCEGLSRKPSEAAGIAAEASSMADVESADGVFIAAALAGCRTEPPFRPTDMDISADRGTGFPVIGRLLSSKTEHRSTHGTLPFAVTLTLCPTDPWSLLADVPRRVLFAEAIAGAGLAPDLIGSNGERAAANDADVVVSGFSRSSHAVLYHIVDHTPENCARENLRALCQRCHNAYDAPMRRRGIKDRARMARASGDLLAVLHNP